VPNNFDIGIDWLHQCRENGFDESLYGRKPGEQRSPLLDAEHNPQEISSAKWTAWSYARYCGVHYEFASWVGRELQGDP